MYVDITCSEWQLDPDLGEMVEVEDRRVEHNKLFLAKVRAH